MGALEEVVLPALERLGPVGRSGTGYKAMCPVHEADGQRHRPSLVVSIGTEQDVVLHCHAGCQPAAILDALGLSWADVSSENGHHERAESRYTAIYDYRDENRVLLFQVCRTPRKEFFQRVPDASEPSGYRWGLGDTRRVPYRLPELLAAVHEGAHIWVVEGEKDVETLRSQRIAATCNPGGAGKWTAEMGEYLRGADITVVADNDPTGLAHARLVISTVETIAKSWRIVSAHEGKDITDHLLTHHLSLEEVDVRWTSQEQADQTRNPELTRLERMRVSIVDTQTIDSIPDPEPLLDGVIFLNSIAWLIGPPGAGKSLVTLDMAGHIATNEVWAEHRTVHCAPVLYVIGESFAGTKWRLRAWEEAMGHPMTGVKFLPMAVQASNHGAWQDLTTLAVELGAGMVVLDTQARMTVGLEENSAKDMGMFVEKLEELRETTGACIMPIHHTARNGELPRGSSAIDGAAGTIMRVRAEGPLVTVDCPKQKDAEPFEPLMFRRISTRNSAIISPWTQQMTIDVTMAVQQPWVRHWWTLFGLESVALSTVVDAGVVKKATFYNYRPALVRAQVLEQIGEGRLVRYRLLRSPELSFSPSESKQSPLD